MEYKEKMLITEYLIMRTKRKALDETDLVLRMIEDAFIAGMNQSKSGHQEALGDWFTHIIKGKQGEDYRKIKSKQYREVRKQKLLNLKEDEIC